MSRQSNKFIAPGVSASKISSSFTGTKTANYTATANDTVIPCDASGGGFDITLPSAASNPGLTLKLIKIDSTFTALGVVGTINGQTNTTLNTQYEALTVVSNGTDWNIEQRYVPSDWTAYTPTGSWSSNVAYTGYWKRIGDSVSLMVKIDISGSVDNAALKIYLPSGINMDTTKLMSPTPDSALLGLGGGLGLSPSPADYIFRCYYGTDNTTIHVYIANVSATFETMQVVSDTVPVTWGSGDFIYFQVQGLPISGWKG